jgi:chorismate synthase
VHGTLANLTIGNEDVDHRLHRRRAGEETPS